MQKILHRLFATTRKHCTQFCLTFLLGFIALSMGVTAQAAATAKITKMAPADGQAPLPVQLDGSLSSCTGGCKYLWTFNDNSSPGTSVASSTTHTYVNAGTYNTTLTVTDINGVKATASVSITASQGETLNTYVNSCKQELAFTDADVAAIASGLNCNKGLVFAPGPAPVNDSVGYARVNDSVDLVFACRWLSNDFGQPKVPPFILAVSIELMLHNRKNGNTCFFQAKPKASGASTSLVSPTVAAAAGPNTPEGNYWNAPIELNRDLPCARCHIAGPYIATPRISPFLARFGLLNNGHDTFGLTTNAQGNIVGRYRAVGTTFNHFNSMFVANNGTDTCTSGCHNIGYGSTATDVLAGINQVLLPAIQSVIDLSATRPEDISIENSGVMPPLADTSEYRWINRDTAADGIESENFNDAQHEFPILQNCGLPRKIEAHAVGTDAIFTPEALAAMPDKFRSFNLRDGLFCDKNDQTGGRLCNNYRINYQCDGVWQSNWVDADNPTSGGQEIEQSTNVCPTGQKLTAMKALTQVGRVTYTAVAPNDKLAQFNATGLVCRNSDQPNGATCSNYVVRFKDCLVPVPSYSARFTSSWIVSGISRRLTTPDSNQNDTEMRAQPTANWDTQGWIVEPIAGGNRVRLKNFKTGKYLTAQGSSPAEHAKVVGYDFRGDWTSQEWILEPISGTNQVRIKNVFNPRYLNVADSSNYSAILMQTLNTGWDSQKWVIQ